MDIQETRNKVIRIYTDARGEAPREGTALMDWFINVLSIILAPFDADMELLRTQLRVNAALDPDSLEPEIVDAFASNFFVERQTGSKSSGTVKVSLASPENVIIPAGTVFSTSQGQTFSTSREYAFAKAQLTLSSGVYETPQIAVEATAEGDSYQIAAGQINSVSATIPGLVGVTNEVGFSAGKTTETNRQLVTRIIDGVSTRGLDMAPGISYKLKTAFPSLVEDILVVGAGEEEMIRDRIHELSSGDGVPFQTVDFGRKVAGLTGVPHVGFKLFDSQSNPPIASFTDELETAEYDGIRSLGDESLTVATGNILSEDWSRFGQSGEPVSTNAPKNGWKVGETGGALSYEGGLSSITVENGVIILGRDAQTLKEVEILEEEIQSRYTQGYSPVVQKTLSADSGMQILGDFKTTDEAGRLSYVTFGKFSEAATALAYEGFGFAWTVSDGNNSPNVFIVDNNASGKLMFIAGNELANPKMVESHLASTSIEILPNTKYFFELIVNEPQTGQSSVATELRIWADTDSRPSSATLSYGAYTPMNKRSLSVEGTPQNLNAMDFGIGVLNSGNALWEYGPLSIVGIAELYACARFDMDVQTLSGDPKPATIEVSYRGSGSNVGSEDDGAALYIYNHTEAQWEILSQNETSGSLYARISMMLSSDYVQANFISLLVSSLYPHDGNVVVPIYSQIIVDYVAVKQVSDSVGIGGKTDVYVKGVPNDNFTPEAVGSVDVPSLPARLAMSTGNGFSLPIARIKSIQILAGGNPTGSELVENVDFRMVSGDDGLRFSSRENNIIVVDSGSQGLSVRVNYTYFNIASIQTNLESADNRQVGTDVLVKHLQPIFVSVSMTANYSSDSVVLAIKKYIWSAQEAIEVSDLIDVAYQGGATSVTLPVQIASYYYDSLGNRVELLSNNKLVKTRTQVFVPLDILIS